MTRKDYELIAAQFRASYEWHVELEINEDDGPMRRRHAYSRSAIEILARDMADALERDNPKFNRHIFLVACGHIADHKRYA